MTHSHTEMTGSSLDITEQRKNELKQLFPGVFTETKNDQGELVHTLDFERLKAELGEFSDIYDNRRERYGMDWPGKRDCLRLVQEPSHATLTPCREESVDFDTTENLFIEGDNLEVLKLLQKSYYGQVKMIYIDPPYNTGKEFIYPDNFSESLDTYLQYAGLKETGGEGRKWSTNSANEGRFHTKWLNMMFPRLYLARNLLREDGVIFISIDDNEVENLRRMCDEIFGEENFLSQLIVQSNKRGQTYKEIAKCHEYILIYYKTDSGTVNELEKAAQSLPFLDDIGRYDLWELRNRNPKFGRHNRPNLYYPIYINPDKLHENSLAEISLEKTDKYYIETFPRNSEGADSCWRWGKDKLKSEGIFGAFPVVMAKQKKDGGWNIYEKSRKSTTKAKSIWSDSAVITEQGTVEAGKLNLSGMLEFPKPVELIKRCLRLGTSGDDIVMDFFAGSGTIAQAAMELSMELNNSYKYIAVQLPEPIADDSMAGEKGYRTIADISKERIRRVSNKVRVEINGQLDLEDKQNLDLGFKVLKLNQSNFKQWQAPDKSTTDEALLKQIALGLDHIDPNASQEDLLYELLIKAGVMPTEKIEPLEWAGHKIFSVAEGSLLVYLELAIDQALIDAVLAKAPSQFICLDSAFQGNDPLKTNAVKTFATFNSDKQGIDRIEFTTV